MFLEIAQIDVMPGQEAAFEASAEQAVPLFRRAKGCHEMRLHRSVEVSSRYWLVVRWEAVEDHTVHFRGSEDFQEWRRLVGSYFASPPTVEHVAALPFGF
jgi:heme-degrading monooxygenase HmoA